MLVMQQTLRLTHKWYHPQVVAAIGISYHQLKKACHIKLPASVIGQSLV